KVQTLAAGLGMRAVGGAIAIGIVDARNLIGQKTDGTTQRVEVKAYVTSSSVACGGSVTVSASEGSTIAASVESLSAAAAVGLIAVAAAGAGVSIANIVRTDVKAYVQSTTGTGVTAQAAIAILASDTSIISSLARAVSFSAAVGLGAAGALSLSVANNTIENDVEAYATSAKLVTSTGDLVITATEAATITSTSTAAAAAFSAFFSAAGAGATSDATVRTTVRAYADPVELDIAGAVKIDAISTATASATTTGAALTVAFIVVAVVRTDATATVTPTVESRLGGYADPLKVAKAHGTITVASTLAATATARADGGSVAAGLGISDAGPTATATIGPTAAIPDAKITSWISGGNVLSTAGGVTVKANYNSDVDGKVAANGTVGKATAHAASGGLITNQENTATASVVPVVDAQIGPSSHVNVTGNVDIEATDNPEGDANTKGVAVGGITVSGSESLVTVAPTATAYIGANAQINAGGLTLS